MAFARSILRQSIDDVRHERRFLASALAAVAVPSALVDILVVDSAAAFLNCVISLVTLYIQLLVTFRMLDRHAAAPVGYRPSDRTQGRFPTAFVAGLLSGLGIAAGLILLIVPGVLLLSLWSLSNVTIAAEGLGASDGLRRSWALVRPALRDVTVVVTGFVLAVATLVGVLHAAAYWLPAQRWLTWVVVDGAMPAVVLGSAIVWVRVYLALRKPRIATT